MRQSWTDDRLDDLAKRVDTGFARVDAQFVEVRAEIAALRVSQERLGAELRGEMNRRFEALEARFDRFQTTMVGGFLSLLAALIALHFS